MLPVAIVIGAAAYLLAWAGITGGSVSDELRALLDGTKSDARTQWEERRTSGAWRTMFGGGSAGSTAPGAVVDPVATPAPVTAPAPPTGGSGGGKPDLPYTPVDIPPGAGIPGTDRKGRPITLVKIGQSGHKLRADAAASFKRAEQRLGRPIKVTDSYRSRAQQEEGHRRKPGTVAPPGRSYHEDGIAIDVVEMNAPDVAQALAAEGWLQADWKTSGGVVEVWHWSWKVKG